MRLSREVNNRIHSVFQRAHNSLWISDVAMHQTMARTVEPFNVVAVSSVSERVEIDDRTTGYLLKYEPHKSRPDEARASGDEKFHIGYPQRFNC